MKKFLTILIYINFLTTPAQAVIVDSFADNSLDSSLVIKKQTVQKQKDSLLDNLDSNLKIKPLAANNIEDEMALALPQTLKLNERKQTKIFDEVLPRVAKSDIKKTQLKKAVISENSTKIAVRIKNDFTTKIQPEEGEYLDFELVSDVKINNKTYPAGTKVVGRVETVSMNTSMGVPSDVVIGSFRMNDLALNGEIKKIGANRSLWVYPAVYAGCMFFGAGLLLMPIRGGHAQLKVDETHVLYY